MRTWLKNHVSSAAALQILLFLVVVVVTASLLGHALFDRGVRDGRRAATSAAADRGAIETRILSIIVKRNPDASIQDFLDFPRHLLDESARVRIDYRLIMALVEKESDWQPRAVGAKGEIGLMQLRPATAALVARRLGMTTYRPPVPARTGYAQFGTLGEPKANLTLGVTFLAWQRDEVGQGMVVALRAYNRGPARAREHWPDDTYTSGIGLRLISIMSDL